jgi:hypothetical protein
MSPGIYTIRRRLLQIKPVRKWLREILAEREREREHNTAASETWTYSREI